MKPVLTEDSMEYYVSEGDLIRFIDENSDMGWNNICDYIVEKEITSEEERSYYDRRDFIDGSDCYNEHQVKWIGAFFEAHPWIRKMVLVFDD